MQSRNPGFNRLAIVSHRECTLHTCTLRIESEIKYKCVLRSFNAASKHLQTLIWLILMEGFVCVCVCVCAVEWIFCRSNAITGGMHTHTHKHKHLAHSFSRFRSISIDLYVVRIAIMDKTTKFVMSYDHTQHALASATSLTLAHTSTAKY